ncbi:MAG: acetate/propionate family kinase [Thermoleophilaceae bacterium]
MDLAVLTVNAGSSSLKLDVVEGDDEAVASERLPALGPHELPAALEDFLARVPAPDAAGHRVVHGGERLRAAARVDPDVRAALDGAAELAPLHVPPALAALDALARLRPDLPAVACLDTAFHSTLPAAAATYALPAAWRERWPLRRFGFHGLSHAWVARRVPELLASSPSSLRIVSCHLGAGASLAAIADGRSVDTTMGFTPLEGLAMATRSGSVDPGLVLWLQRRGGLSATAVEQGLEREGGLLGLSRRSADMRAVIEGADAGDEHCRLALDVYLHRLRAGIAAMAAALGGVDALAFTGGVGEASPRIRADAVAGLGFLGLSVDLAANAGAEGDAEPGVERRARDAVVSPAGARSAVLVVEAREELQMASEVLALLR